MNWVEHTDKKENQIFLIYKEIQSGAVAKSYIRKGFLVYEEMGKYFPMYEEAVSHIWICNCSILNFLIYEDFIFYQCTCVLTYSFYWTYILLKRKSKVHTKGAFCARFIHYKLRGNVEYSNVKNLPQRYGFTIKKAI